MNTTTEASSFFDSVKDGVLLTNDPMAPQGSFSLSTHRSASADGVSVIDGRLHFNDVDAYVTFIQAATTWTDEERLAWEAEKGFVSLQTVNEDTTFSSSARYAGEIIAMPDPVAGSSLSPSGVIGIGDRVYDIEGSELIGYDLDGNQVGTQTVVVECGEFALDCGGGGSGGGSGGGGSTPLPENTYVQKQFGTIESDNPNVRKRYQLTATIFRVHYWLYSSIGGETYSHVRKYNSLRGNYYADHVPYAADLFCEGRYAMEDGSTDTRTAFETYDGEIFQPTTDEFRVYFDQDVFDFTGTGNLKRIDCTHSLTSNRRSWQPSSVFGNDPNQSSGDVTTGRNF